MGTIIRSDDHRALLLIAEHIDGEVGTVDVSRTAWRLSSYILEGELSIQVIRGERRHDGADTRLFELRFADGLEPIRIPVRPLAETPPPHVPARARALRAAGLGG